MFANFVRLLTGRPQPEVERSAFIQEVRVLDAGRERREPRVERLILVCWLLIAVKHITVRWAIYHYHVPFDALWVNFPTWLLGVLATGIYYARARRR